MVVIVQFLAADEDSHGEDVGRGIGAIEIAVAPVVPEAVANIDQRRIDRIEVPCVTLDNELERLSRILLLKIDVEGSELRVLEGARQTLARTACVNCEMGDAHYRRDGYGMPDLIAVLQLHGFQTFVVDGARRVRPVDAQFAEPGGHELVACRDAADFAQRTGWRLR